MVSLRYFALLGTLLAIAAPAAAKPLFSVWTLEEVGPVGAVDAEFGTPFLVQKLLPYKLVQLLGDAQLHGKGTIASQTYLFAVFQSDGQIAYCTVKDQSLGNVSKSMFIPALDKRPCLIDADDDGRFEASFGVFDKYGSALTPSGNLSSAKPLKLPVTYEKREPRQFPFVRQFDYALAGSKDPLKTRIDVRYDNGSGFKPMVNDSRRDSPTAPTALNVGATIERIVGDRAQITIAIKPDLVVVGESGGTFGAGPIPDFVKKAP